MNEALVSVIIPTYNRCNIVSRAIDSVLAQTYRNIELIVIDDGSTDQTGALIATKYGAGVKYLYQKNSGVSSTRNHGIRVSRGQYIAFLDSDDSWAYDKLEKQMKFLQENKKYKICYTDEIWIRAGNQVQPREIHQKYGGRIFAKCIPRCIISPSSVIIARGIIDKIGLFDTNLPVCEDYDYWLRLSATYPIAYIEEKLITKYGGHADQLSRRYPVMDRYRVYALEKILTSPHLEEPVRDMVLESIIQRCAIISNGAFKRKRYALHEKFNDKRVRYENIMEVGV